MELQKDWLSSKTHAREQKDPRSPISHWNKHSLHLDVAAAGTPEDELITHLMHLHFVYGYTCLLKNRLHFGSAVIPLSS